MSVKLVLFFFSTLGGLSFMALLFLVPFVVDPAVLHIQADFDPNPVQCELVEAVFKIGLSACSWSSCMEGCTRELFKCFQVRKSSKISKCLQTTSR